MRAELGGQVELAIDRGLGVVGDDDHRVVVEEPLEARRTASTSSARASSARPIDSTCPSGPCLWEW